MQSVDSLVAESEWRYDHYKNHSEDTSGKKGVIEVDIGEWHYWATYYQDGGFPWESKFPYYFDLVWIARKDAAFSQPSNPEDYDFGWHVPVTWLEEASNLIICLLVEQVVKKVEDKDKLQ